MKTYCYITYMQSELHLETGYVYTYIMLTPWAPSDPYMGRTAQLTSIRCILNTYSTKIRTEYFKCAV
jgi:hypothetical protein